ncbi:MAG: proton-conducting transporter membrane subunit, partial [Candidatus Firestonebacteria bacterium]
AFAFAVAIYNKTGSDDIREYTGLSVVRPGLSFVFFVFLLSLAGVPPTAGFIGKLMVLGAALDSGYIWLAVIGVLNSVIALYFYARIAYYMYFVKETKITEPLKLSLPLQIIIYSSLFMTLYICILPEQFFSLTAQTVKLIRGSFHAF